MSSVSALLEALFSEGVPRRLGALIHPDLTLSDLIDFKLNPVLNSDETQATRLAIAGHGDRDEWIKRVAKVWNNSAVITFWGAAPKHARHMVDTDGSRFFVVYNDDIHPPPGPLLALTLSLPKKGPGLLLRTAALPQQLPEPISAGVQELLSAQVGGQWAVRSESNQTTGVLWVSESRWRGNANETSQVVLGLSAAKGWASRWKAIQKAGLNPYPDAVEFRIDGTVDLTVGFLDPTG